jgi:hypothetical protein
MATTKHPKTQRPSDADLKGNPGIGTSKGRAKEDDGLDGDSTFEGDVESDTTPEGGIDPHRRGRKNK